MFCPVTLKYRMLTGSPVSNGPTKEKSQVIAVDINLLEQTLLGSERQIGYAPAHTKAVALYGEYWLPANYGKLTLSHLQTGQESLLLSNERIKLAIEKSQMEK